METSDVDLNENSMLIPASQGKSLADFNPSSASLSIKTSVKEFKKEINLTNENFERSNETYDFLLNKKMDNKERSIVIQKYECEVLEVTEDYFTFKAVNTWPIIVEEQEKEFEDRFYKSEIHEDDQNLIKPRALFYWSIGYFTSTATVTRLSEIRFRRLAEWSEADNIRSLKDAEQIHKDLGII